VILLIFYDDFFLTVNLLYNLLNRELIS